MNVGMSTHKIKGEDYYQCRDVKAERDKLRKEVLRLRVVMAKTAQRADDWPDSNDDPADVLSDCAGILFDALDEDDCDENGEWWVDFTGNTLVTIKHRDGRVWTFECGECDIFRRLKVAMEFIENTIEERKS